MSSPMPMPDPDTFPWADVPDWGNTLPYEHEQTSGQGQVDAQHGQAFDSFHPRHQNGGTNSWTHPPAQSLLNNNQYVETFNFEHLTPEHSVANEHDHTTSNVDDLFWQQDFQSDNTDQPTYGNSALQYNSVVDNPTDLHSLGSQLRHAQLLPSPELTATSTPDTSWHTKTLSGSTSGVNPLTPSSQPPKRQLADLDSSMPHASADRLTHPTVQSYHPVSPVIHISSHSRGDSPARSYFVGSNPNHRTASPARQRVLPPGSSSVPRMSTLEPPRYQEGEDDDDEEDDDVGDAPEPDQSARAGVHPGARTDEVVPSFDDLEKQDELDSTISHVQSWLADTSLSSQGPRASRAKVDPNRARSRSTGARAAPNRAADLQPRRIPGPGVLLDEDSDYHYSSDDGSDEGSLTSLTSDQYGPTDPAPEIEDDPDDGSVLGDTDTVIQDEEPSPKQFFKRSPWQDPPRGPVKSTRAQPESANAAMYRFEQRAKNFETASRAATWGTGRRTSTADAGSIIEDHKTRHLSLSKRTRERGASFINEARNKARELIPRRSNSNLKKSGPQAYADIEKAVSPDSIEHGDPIEHVKSLSPRQSLSKSRSPPTHTGNALIAMSAGLAAVGSSASALNTEVEHSHNPLKRALHRVRSKSEVPKSPKSPTGLTGLIAQQGGMPLPALASPSHELEHLPTESNIPQSQAITQDELTVKMELPVEQAHIIPNIDGFKHEIQRLNPRLEAFLVDRIAHDQLKRYKRLVKNKVDHSKAIDEGNCASRHQCAATGAEAEILATKGNTRDAPSNPQFKIPTSLENDEELDESNFDGVVTPALFPEGIPPPPTTRLPARFECPLCFQVKSFSKPSDWTKHVHEDVQPFTCSFPRCTDPKSFKRKADWVRHENERHRHLEWWRCNLHECQHVCYRKDNFVQHLVREHKKKEPKLKGRNPNLKGKGRVAGNQFTQEERDFWQLVDECRHESSNSPRDEPCRFCGNCLNSWKKLSVHVGKHMEQIAMPVLELAEKRNVTKDTIVSPIEAYANRQQTFSLGGDHNNNGPDPNIASPYYSANSNYQSSSAGHSPSMRPQRPQAGPRSTSQQYLDATYASTMNHMNPGQGSYSSSMAYTTNQGYGNYAAFADPNHMPYHGQPYPAHQMSTSSSYSIPPSQSVDTAYMGGPIQGSMAGAPYQTHQYFASPEMQQTTYAGYDQSMIRGNMTGHGNIPDNAQMQPVVTTSQGMSNSYAFHDQHGPRSGHEYYNH